MQIALAPMEGLVDNILRDVLTRVGGIDWCVTEFIRVNDRLLTPAYFHKLAPNCCTVPTPLLACRCVCSCSVPTRCAWQRTRPWPASWAPR